MTMPKIFFPKHYCVDFKNTHFHKYFSGIKDTDFYCVTVSISFSISWCCVQELFTHGAAVYHLDDHVKDDFLGP